MRSQGSQYRHDSRSKLKLHKYASDQKINEISISDTYPDVSLKNNGDQSFESPTMPVYNKNSSANRSYPRGRHEMGVLKRERSNSDSKVNGFTKINKKYDKRGYQYKSALDLYSMDQVISNFGIDNKMPIKVDKISFKAAKSTPLPFKQRSVTRERLELKERLLKIQKSKQSLMKLHKQLSDKQVSLSVTPPSLPPTPNDEDRFQYSVNTKVKVPPLLTVDGNGSSEISGEQSLRKIEITTDEDTEVEQMYINERNVITPGHNDEIYFDEQKRPLSLSKKNLGTCVYYILLI